MNFLNRLKFYLIGVGIGTLMVYIMFKDRNITSWTPKNRVLNEIAELPMQILDREDCLLLCLEIDVDSLKSLMLDGSVDFSESNIKNKKKRRYQLDLDSEKIQSARVEIREDSTVLLSLALVSDQCGCAN